MTTTPTPFQQAWGPRALGALRETLDEDVRDTQAALHTFPPTETEELTTR